MSKMDRDIDKRKQGQQLLAMLQEYAPNGSAQQKAANIYNESLRCGDDVVKVMAAALFDGLAYGNWPWN